MTIGILGGGQLGRMLALAGYPLGLRFRFLDPDPQAPAGQLAEQIAAPYGDPAAIERFTAGLDVATFEFENVPLAVARAVAARVPLHPAPEALAAKQDRLVEKRFFRGLGIGTAPFAEVEGADRLAEALATVGLPAVLKTRRDGYDGKGQAVLRRAADGPAAVARLGETGLIAEGWVAFERELSLLAVRGRDGATAFYPLVENRHRSGILHRSLAPAGGIERLQPQAEDHARRVLDALGYVGVLAIEFFVTGDLLLANEMAPRVHNSGHWTIEGAETSQFENHLRAVLGMPLGSTAMRGHAAMINLVGSVPDAAAVLAVPGARMHLYGKAPRPGRKLGHVTVCAPDRALLDERLAAIEALVPEGAPGH